MKSEIRNPKSEGNPKSEIQNRKPEPCSGSSWLIILLLLGHLIFCHGCHGEDVDDELCITPPAAKNGEQQASTVSDASQKRFGESGASVKRR